MCVYALALATCEPRGGGRSRFKPSYVAIIIVIQHFNLSSVSARGMHTDLRILFHTSVFTNAIIHM